jgi:hypothetical protein
VYEKPQQKLNNYAQARNGSQVALQGNLPNSTFKDAESPFSIMVFDKNDIITSAEDLKKNMNDYAAHISDQTDQVGILLEGNLWNTIQSVVDEDAFDDIPVKEIRKHISLTFRMSIFSTLGEYVSQIKQTLPCDHVIFQYDCTDPDTEQWIWIGWDPVSNDGRLVGNGVYLGIFESSIHYPGGSTPREIRRDRFGYVRTGGQ